MLVWALASIPVCLKAQAPMETSRHLIEVVSSVDGSPQPSYIILPSEAVVLVEQWRRGVQYRSTPQRLRRSTPRSGSIETITLVPQNASAPGTANGFRSNIASGTAGGGTSRARP